MSELRAKIDALIVAVAQQSTVTASAITLINGLHDQIVDATQKLAENGADTSDLIEITNQISAESSALAAAIEANTPATGVTANAAVSDPAAAPEQTDNAAALTG